MAAPPGSKEEAPAALPLQPFHVNARCIRKRPKFTVPVLNRPLAGAALPEENSQCRGGEGEGGRRERGRTLTQRDEAGRRDGGGEGQGRSSKEET